MQACWFRRCVQKVTRQVLYFVLLTTEPQVNITPFKAVPLVSHTPPETLLPFPLAVLDVFMWKCPQLVCHDVLGVVHSTKTATFEVEFEFRGMEEDTRAQIRRVWGLRNRWNTVFGQKLVQGNGSVTGRVVVLQHPASKCPQCLAGHDEPFRRVVQGPHDSTVDQLFVLEAPIPHEQHLDCRKNRRGCFWFFYLLIVAFFGRGDLFVCHSEICRPVSGSYSNIRASSPVMTCLKKMFPSFLMRSRRSRHTFLRFSFCSLVRFFGTNFAQIFRLPNFSVRMSWTVWWFKFNSLPIILTVQRRSDTLEPSLWSHFLPFLMCKLFQNDVRLSHSHANPKMLYAT